MIERDETLWRIDRLRAASEKAGGDVRLGELLGHSGGSHVGQMVRGGRPITEKTIKKIESIPGFGGWFDRQKSGFLIPQFDTGGRMGNAGVILREQPGVIRSWRVSDEWLQKNVHRITSPVNLKIVTGFGDSMKPIYNPGDPLLMDTGRRSVDVDGIYFFRVGDEGFIKRLQRIPTIDGIIIRAKSENKAYDHFDIVDGMDFEVFGWIVKAWRGEDF